MHLRTVTGLVLLAIVHCQSQAGQLRPARVDAGINKVLARDAERWKMSVIKRDLNALVQFAPPEYREGIKRQLHDKDSLLYKVLFTDPSSVYQLLARQGATIETVLLPHEELKSLGAGTEVCYFDSDRFKPSWPIAIEDLVKLWGNPDVFCLFAFYTEGRWFTAYGFGEEDDGDDD